MNITTKQDKKQYIYGYDFDGTSDHLPILPNSVIITGRYKKDEKILRKVVGDVPIYFLPDNVEHTDENIGKHKGEVVKKLGLRRFFDDNEIQHKIIQEMNPEVTVIHVNPDAIKYVVLTSEGTGIPIAHHLALEGYEVYVGQAESFKELGIESTKEEDEKLQKSQELYKGILPKYPAQKLLKVLEKVKNKDDYFIYCDLNSLYTYGERLLKAGFKKGIFPTKKDYDFEKGREQAMEFVEKHYPDIKIIPFQKVKTVEEARKIVEETEVPLVIQSEGDFVSTICPPDDVEINKTEILSALDKHASEYAKGEIILKEKLVQPVEITPQIVFWDGNPVYTCVDIETKNIGDGENNGNQVGCGTNLIIRTNLDDKINKISFPPIVYEMAKNRKGIFIWDISIYFTEKGMYFGEFCSNRFGYDCVLTEMCMAGGVSKYFDSLQSLKNPLKTIFGAAARVFNLKLSKESEITVLDDDYVWVYETKMKDGKFVSLGVYWDLAVITGEGDTIEEAVANVYDGPDMISFKERYMRTKDDFLRDYPTSIINRFNAVNTLYFNVPEFGYVSDNKSDYENRIKILKNQMDSEYDSKLKSVKDEYSKEIVSIREEIKRIIHA